MAEDVSSSVKAMGTISTPTSPRPAFANNRRKERPAYELDRMPDLAEQAAERLSSLEGTQLLGTTHLSIVAFRASAGDEATRAISDTLIASRAMHVSSTTIDGYVYVRLAFLNQRTTQAVLDTVVDIVRSAVPHTA